MESFAANAALKLLEKALSWVITPLRDRFLRLRRRNQIRASAGRKIGILLARLDGDTDTGSLRETIRETIRRELDDAVEIVLWPEALRVEDGHEYDAERGAYAKAQKWLASKHCDLLVWGRIKGQSVLSMRFTLAEIGSPNAETYKLTETFDLPISFIANLGVAITTRIFVTTVPTLNMSGQYLVPLMRNTAERLEPIVHRLNSAFSADTRGALLEIYARVQLIIGDQTGADDHLKIAIDTYHKVLEEFSRERLPLAWALTQNSLGFALWTLGKHGTNNDLLKQAVVAFQESLKEFDRVREPADWAMAQNNLGLALWALGEREAGNEQLEQAVSAFREALCASSQEKSPLAWAMAHNNLGSVLAILGGRESDTKRLEQAHAAFREALKELTRDRAPLDWAKTHVNLALILRLLAEREGGTPRLEEAVMACRDALKEYRHDRVTT
jgi:tetratricopeptide (TPR) repeat protein